MIKKSYWLVLFHHNDHNIIVSYWILINMPNYLHFNLGTRRGLVVTTPGSQVRVRRFGFLLGLQTSGLTWLLYKYVALWRTVNGPSAHWKTPWIYSQREGNFFPVMGFYLIAIWPKLLKARLNPKTFLRHFNLRLTFTLTSYLNFSCIFH